jgi:hypothetical protein
LERDVQLEWQKGPAGEACLLDRLDVSLIGQADAPYGVFVIWRSGVSTKSSVVLYVGRGILRREIADCRRDPLIRGELGLQVTWASVDVPSAEAVAAYLGEQLQPVWGEMVPGVQPMPVNLPVLT